MSDALQVAHVVGTLENGQVFLDTREVNIPIKWEWGIIGNYIPEGLQEGLEGIRTGGRRLVFVPPELGYGTSGLRLPQVFPCLPPRELWMIMWAHNEDDHQTLVAAFLSLGPGPCEQLE
jgi:FKBP-type peptidyl-prolyl cis-trans isomerase